MAPAQGVSSLGVLCGPTTGSTCPCAAQRNVGMSCGRTACLHLRDHVCYGEHRAFRNYLVQTSVTLTPHPCAVLCQPCYLCPRALLFSKR